MAKGRSGRKTPDPAAQGEAWRVQMAPDRECLASLIWKRVFALYRIDLSDPRQATGLQVYRLLAELMADAGDVIDVEAIDLESCVDCRIPRVFGSAK